MGGSLDIDEFCEGVWQVVVSQSPIEMRRLEKQMDAVRRDMIVLHQQHNEVLKAVTHIRRSLDVPSEGMMSSLSHGQVQQKGRQPKAQEARLTEQVQVIKNAKTLSHDNINEDDCGWLSMLRCLPATCRLC